MNIPLGKPTSSTCAHVSRASQPGDFHPDGPDTVLNEQWLFRGETVRVTLEGADVVFIETSLLAINPTKTSLEVTIDQHTLRKNLPSDQLPALGKHGSTSPKWHRRSLETALRIIPSRSA